MTKNLTLVDLTVIISRTLYSIARSVDEDIVTIDS